MKKESIGKIILGKWDTKTVVGIAIGVALFGVLMAYGSVRIYGNTTLATAMIVPVLVGGLFGPVPAMIACFLGNCLADLLAGWGFYISWSIGNGILGFIVGCMKLYGADIENGKFGPKEMVIYSIVSVIGCGIAYGVVAPFLDVYLLKSSGTVNLIQGMIASVSDILVLLVIGIPVLKALAARNAKSQNLTKEN